MLKFKLYDAVGAVDAVDVFISYNFLNRRRKPQNNSLQKQKRGNDLLKKMVLVMTGRLRLSINDRLENFKLTFDRLSPFETQLLRYVLKELVISWLETLDRFTFGG